MDRRISTTLGVKAKQLVSISRKDGGRFHTWGATSLPSGSICRYAENAKTASLLFSSASQVSCACPFSKCRQHLKMPSTRLARRLLQHYAPERVLYCPVVSTEFCDHTVQQCSWSSQLNHHQLLLFRSSRTFEPAHCLWPERAGAGATGANCVGVRGRQFQHGGRTQAQDHPTDRRQMAAALCGAVPDSASKGCIWFWPTAQAVLKGEGWVHSIAPKDPSSWNDAPSGQVALQWGNNLLDYFQNEHFCDQQIIIVLSQCSSRTGLPAVRLRTNRTQW